jgi:hypothetical protein
MKLVVLLAAAVVATPVEQSPESSPLVQAARDSKTLPEAAEVAEAGADREGKLFSVFEIVRFNNEACTGDDGKSGVCYTAAQCTGMGGTATGNCAMGFGVCCRILVDPTCPSDITTASATIVNPGYPNDVATATAGSCSSSSGAAGRVAPRIFFPTTTTTTTATQTSVTNVEVSGTETMYRWAIYKATPTVEQIRIDFVEFDIAPPKLGACSNESMTIMGADAVTNKILPDKLCGVLTGQHVYLSVKDLGTDFLTIEITLSKNGTQEWEMLVTQIEGDATADLAPRGCLQYFKEDAATFSSFNWNGGNGELINDNQYSICIMDNDAYCDVALTANSMFELTQTSGTCMDKIAFGTNVYCGTTFNDATNMATWNFTGAYNIPVFTDGDNTAMAVGFEISYVLLPC